MKRIVSLLAMLAMVVFLAAPMALAQGQVERGTEHANSICSFSGLNDHDPEEPPGGLTQSYGQELRLAIRTGVLEPGDQAGKAAPGTLCNGHLFPYPEAFEGMPE